MTQHTTHSDSLLTTYEGVGMMELVAMHLKAQGSYISRSLSYTGCKVGVGVCVCVCVSE